MKTAEILLASSVLACLAAVGTTLATRAFQAGNARASGGERAAPEQSMQLASLDDPASARLLDDLHMQNSALQERLSALEALLGDLQTSRTPVATLSEEGLQEERQAGIPGNTAIASDGSVVVTPAFVASVGRALDTLEAEEEAERQARRKEMQAERVEERVAKLQQELGLTRGQAGDMRSLLIEQDDSRDRLFSGMRDGSGDPRKMREEFRTMRDEADEAIKNILTPDQYDSYRENERSDWGGFGRDRGDRGGGGDGRGGRGGGNGGGGNGGGDGRRGGR